MRRRNAVLLVAVIAVVCLVVVRACNRPPREPVRRQAAHPRAVTTVPAPSPPRVTVPSAARMGSPRLAVILDDWGNHYSLLKDAIAVGRPLTLAVLPNLPASSRIAEEAHRAGLGVMLHLPMQPVGGAQPLEPGTIKVTTPDGEIRRLIDLALRSVPHAEGANNHMGSRATSDPRVMRAVLGHLDRKGLFFIDSNTISTTVAPEIAEEVGIPFEQRDVFIDNVSQKEAVKKELLRAARMARRRGDVIVIGHDKRATLAALKEALPEIEKGGVRLVLARDLARVFSDADGAEASQ